MNELIPVKGDSINLYPSHDHKQVEELITTRHQLYHDSGAMGKIINCIRYNKENGIETLVLSSFIEGIMISLQESCSTPKQGILAQQITDYDIHAMLHMAQIEDMIILNGNAIDLRQRSIPGCYTNIMELHNSISKQKLYQESGAVVKVRNGLRFNKECGIKSIELHEFVKEVMISLQESCSTPKQGILAQRITMLDIYAIIYGVQLDNLIYVWNGTIYVLSTEDIETMTVKPYPYRTLL